MKKLFFLIFISIFVFSCSQQHQSDEQKEDKTSYDFRTHNWGDSFKKVTSSESIKDYKIYESEGVIEVEYEDSFYGVSSDIDNLIVARMACFFVDDKLKGGWYYIYTKKQELDLDKEVNLLYEKYGEPNEKYYIEDNNSNNYIWIKDNTAIKVLARDADEFVRFEAYFYELNWYKENLAK